MNYVLALFLPPLSVLFAGRPLLALIIFLVWIPAIIFSGGLTHPMFILLAWIIIYERRDERRRHISGVAEASGVPDRDARPRLLP
jgi:hypothetical protein